ncbi:nitrate ABC transporter permease, partial [Leucobacter sp. OLES1]
MTLTSTVMVRTREARRQRRSGIPRWALIGAEIAVPILLLAAWWFASANSTNTFFPPLRTILT